MNIMIDFILCIIALAVLLAAFAKNTIVLVSRTFALAVAVLLSVLITMNTAPLLADALPNPYYRTAVRELADLSEAPKLDSAQQTLAQLDIAQLNRDHPEEMKTLLARYNTTWQEAQAEAARSDGSADAFVRAMAKPVWRATVSAVERLLLTAICYVLLALAGRALLYQFFPKDKKRKSIPLTAVFAVVYTAIVLAYVAVPVFEEFRPYSMGALKLLGLDAACSKSAVYSFFRTLNIL